MLLLRCLKTVFIGAMLFPHAERYFLLILTVNHSDYGLSIGPLSTANFGLITSNSAVRALFAFAVSSTKCTVYAI